MNPTSPSHAEGRVAALHRAGDSWRLVVLQTATPGPTLVEARTLPIGDAASVRATLDRHGVGRLIRVLPASSALCRVVETPEGDAASIASALALIAEATLPSHLPAHRRAAAPLAGINGTIGSRSALIVGWAGAANEPPIGGMEESWTAEPAALLWLVRLRCRAALFADRETGSISAFAAGSQRVIVRALKESSDAADRWTEALDQCFAQTVSGAGLVASARRVEGDGVSVRLDAGSIDLFKSLGAGCDDDQWLARYGTAAAAAMGAIIAPVSMRPLHSLTAEPRAESESRLSRALRAVAAPRRAPWIIAGALAAALLVPLGIQAARHALLSAKSGGLAVQQEAERREALRSQFHGLLETRRWPMTRLLAAVSGLLPVGITVDSVRIESGQRVSIKGRADSLDLANVLQTRLNASGVFDDAVVDRSQTLDKGDGVEFDVSARVTRPYTEPKGGEDFAAQPLAQRLYGAEYSRGSSASGIAPDRATSTKASSDDSGAARPPARERTTKPAAKPAEIPEPISDEEIEKLDASAAMKQWTSRQKASKQSGIDAATRDRLKAEAEKCRARMQSARKEASP